MTPQPLIQIVDDDKIVHKLLSALLIQAGYRVVEAFRGQEALDQAEENRPDLILLDIMMPEMNGFEVLKKLKSHHSLNEIPVVLLSAKVETQDKVHGLELGAADFVNKPFDRAELLARIRTQLKLKNQEEALREYSQNLERMVEERTRQLIHADRLASLGTLSAGIAHEINNPTTFITGNLQTIETFWNKMLEYLKSHPEGEADPKLQYIIREFPEIIKSIRNGADRITGIVAGLKAYSRKDSTAKQPVNLLSCLDEALQLTNNRLKYHVQVEKKLPEKLPSVMANAQQLVQVFVNLIVNAADALGDSPGLLEISASTEDHDQVVLTFSDNGPGIPPKVINKVFDPFFTTKPLGQGTGLGLSISHGIIQDHKGSITVKNNSRGGATFTISLPKEKSS